MNIEYGLFVCRGKQSQDLSFIVTDLNSLLTLIRHPTLYKTGFE